MEKILNEELLKQLSLIKYDRSKTLFENHVGLINEENQWPKITLTEKKDRTQYCYVDEDGKKTPIGIIEDGIWKPTEFGKKMMIFTFANLNSYSSGTHSNGARMFVQCDEYGKEDNSKTIEEAITFVSQLGFTTSAIGTNYGACKSANEVFARAAIYGLKKITDIQIGRTAIGTYDCLTVKINALDGSAPKPFSMGTFSRDETFGEKLNGVIGKLIIDGATLNADVSIGSLFFLQSFYFAWGKIVNDYIDAFKTDKDAWNSKLFPDGWWNFFNFWYKGSSFTKALSDVKSSEKFRCNGNTIINTTYGEDWVTRNQKEGIKGVKDMVTTMAHIALPLGSFLLTIGSGGLLLPILLGSGLELIDASIYMFVNKDPYMAGMAAIFALVGPLDFGLGVLVAKVGRPLLKKLALKIITFTDDELELLKYATKNGVRLAKLAKLNAGRQLIKHYFKTFENSSKVAQFCFFLIKKFGLPIGKVGLYMGSPVYSWDFIAAKLGLCNSMELKGLKQSDWKILKIIGYLGEPLQPFTEGCGSVLAEKTLANLEKTLLTNNARIKMSIEEGIKAGMVYSTKLSNIYMYEVLYIQYILTFLGFDYFRADIPDSQVVYKKGVKLTKGQCMSIFLRKNFSGPDLPVECNQYVYEFKELYNYDKKVPFKWGYYDNQTKKMIEQYQSDGFTSDLGYPDIKIDGVCGNDNLNKMLGTMKRVNKEIPNYSKANLDPEEIKNIRNKTIEEMNKLKTKWEGVSKKTLEIELDKQTDSIQRKVEKEIEKLEFTDGQLVEITNRAKEIESMG